MSEKKRRDVIQQGYADLNKLVPCLSAGKAGLSRSESLHEVADFLECLVLGNERVMGVLGVHDVEVCGGEV